MAHAVIHSQPAAAGRRPARPAHAGPQGLRSGGPFSTEQRDRAPARGTAEAPGVRWRPTAACACGGVCPRCAEALAPPGVRRGVGRNDDALEAQADRVAERSLAATPRLAAPLRGEREAAPSLTPATTPAPLPVSASDVPMSVVHTVSSPGRPLEAGLRADMEQRFGHDFSQVRVHAGGSAEASSRELGALAYTVGHDLVFAPGRYAPGTQTGRRLLAHELAHVVQQTSASSAGGVRLQRQCDPAWASLPWAERVTNAKAAAGTSGDQCMTELLDEALPAHVTMHESSNTEASVDAAAAASKYTNWGSMADLHINYDRDLDRKTRHRGLYGETVFSVPADGSSLSIFITLGPAALNAVGPQFARMAADHETAHAADFVSQWAGGSGSPHAATAEEELAIHTTMFSRYFLDIWIIDNATRRADIAANFMPVFNYYEAATQPARDAAFARIETFYNNVVSGVPCNLMKFKIWMQFRQNGLPDTNELVGRINGLAGMGLTRGTSPGVHFDAALGCS